MVNTYDKNRRQEALEMYKDGHSFSEIEESTGLSYCTVQNYIHTAKMHEDPVAREAQTLRRIHEIIHAYEVEFHQIFKK